MVAENGKREKDSIVFYTMYLFVHLIALDKYTCISITNAIHIVICD